MSSPDAIALESSAEESGLDDLEESRDDADIDKKELLLHLQETQCPLMPARYEKVGKCSAYYFNKKMWRKDDDDSCVVIELSPKKKRKAMDDAELIMAVDEWISQVHINKSHHIYNKLVNAFEEARHGSDDGNKQNDAYQNLIPKCTGMFFVTLNFEHFPNDFMFSMFSARFTFLFSMFALALNGYFVVNGLIKSINASDLFTHWHFEFTSSFMYEITTLILGGCEVLLFINIILSEILVNLFFMCLALRNGDPVYLEAKTIATEIKNLSTLSLLRYMLSVELVSWHLINWKESGMHIYASMILSCSSTESNSKRTNWCARIFKVPIFIVETFAPIMAIIAILVKIRQMEFVFTGDPWSDWTTMNFVNFFAFLNQVAGLRVLRDVETETIQHFVFSGADAMLDTEERLLLDDWWNITLLSAVSNLNLNWFDNMVFWYSLDPRNTQLLLKNHVPQGKSGSGPRKTCEDIRKKARESDVILDAYDDKVFRKFGREPSEDRDIRLQLAVNL